MGKENLAKTYYYDYQKLKISLKSSEIMKENYQFELDEILAFDKTNLVKIKELKNKIQSRQKIIDTQQKLLTSMENVIESFPKQLEKPEDKVYKLKVIDNCTDLEVADELGYCEQHIRYIMSNILKKFIDWERIIEKKQRLQ